MTDTLPPLPEPALSEIVNRSTGDRCVSDHGVAYYGSNWQINRDIYTADQMRAYAAAAVAAEREACAALCVQRMPQPAMNWADAQIVGALRECAEAIRARKP